MENNCTIHYTLLFETNIRPDWLISQDNSVPNALNSSQVTIFLYTAKNHEESEM